MLGKYFLFVLTIFVVESSGRPQPFSKLEIVCYVQFYPELSNAVLRQVRNCSYVIVTNNRCNVSKPLRRLTDRRKMAQLRNALDSLSNNETTPPVRVLREISIPSGLNDTESLLQLVNSSLQYQLFDGVHLDYDPGHLDISDQVRYSRMIAALRRHLGSAALLSTSITCRRPISTELAETLDEKMNFVILEPTMEESLRFNTGSAFIPRTYSGSRSNCLIDAGISRRKIILGLPTGGTPFDPSASDPDAAGYMPYDEVCELSDYSQNMTQGLLIVYDDQNSAGGRALQVMSCRFKGISIRLDYDDQCGSCSGEDFPLLDAILDVIERRSGRTTFGVCPYDPEDYDYSILEDDLKLRSPHRTPNNESDLNSVRIFEPKNSIACIHCELFNMMKHLELVIRNAEVLTGMLQTIADRVLGTLDSVVTLFAVGFRNNYPGQVTENSTHSTTIASSTFPSVTSQRGTPKQQISKADPNPTPTKTNQDPGTIADILSEILKSDGHDDPGSDQNDEESGEDDENAEDGHDSDGNDPDHSKSGDPRPLLPIVPVVKRILG